MVGWTRSSEDRHCSSLSSAVACSHQTSMVSPTWDGGFSQPHRKFHSLKHNISLGWNLRYFSSVICIYSYSLCPSAWHRETKDQSKSLKSHIHMPFPLNTHVQLGLITTDRVHLKFWIHWPRAGLSSSELWHSHMRPRRWRDKVTLYFKHLILHLCRAAKFRTKRSFDTSMERGILQQGAHSPDFMFEFRLLS